MRSLRFLALITILAALPALAQNPPKSSTFSVRTEQQRTDIEIGAAVFNTHAAQIRIAYLPRLQTLPGTFPARGWGDVPNAFELTRTQIPERPRVMPAYIVTR